MSMFHKDAPTGDIHQIHQWTYADATAKAAATGFSSSDVGKVALQLDTGAYYILTDDSPITWQKIGSTTSADLTAANVSNTPSGNLAAATVQAALNELQSDIDTRATSASVTSAISTHEADTTSVHGIADTSDLSLKTATETLTGKTFSDPLTLTEVASPAAPAASKRKLYTKSDGKIYHMGSDGVETLVGSGSGAGGLNLLVLGSTYSIDNADDHDAEGSVGRWTQYADAAATSPVDMTGGTPGSTAPARSTTAPLNGSASIVWDLGTGSSRQGEGMVLGPVYVPPGYRGRQLTFKGVFKATGTLVDGDVVPYAYVISSTAGLLAPTFVSGKILGSGGAFSASFDIPSDCATMRIGFHVARTATSSLVLFFDDLKLTDEANPIGDVLGAADPAGTIVAFSGTTDPTGWMICDGRSLLRASYPELFTAIGTAYGTADATHFNIPDLRGRFLRGVDYTANVAASGLDPDKASRTAMATGGNTGSNVGSVQGDQYSSHTHTLSANVTSGSSGAFNSIGGGSAAGSLGAVLGGVANASGGNETRPKNANVHFIIKLYGDVKNVTLASSSTFKISSYLANGTRVTSAPTKLGEYRSYLRNAGALTLTETNGSPISAPSVADGIRLDSVATYASADTSGRPSAYEVFVGKNKNVKVEFYQSTGRTGYVMVSPHTNSGIAYDYGVNWTYDPTTGIVQVRNFVNGSTNLRLGIDPTTASSLSTAYFDITVSENALAVGVSSPRSEVSVYTPNGYGATSTKIRCFLTVGKNTGTAITYTADTTNGDKFTINEDGIYAISYSDQFTSSNDLGISLNSSQLTTSIYSITTADIIAVADSPAANAGGLVSSTLFLPAGSIVRAHTNGTAAGSNTPGTRFRITKVSN